MDAFINTKCLSNMRQLLVSLQNGVPIDFTTVLGLLRSISHTFTRIDHSHDDALQFIETVNEFIYKEGTGITEKINTLPQNQIKDLKEGEIIAVLKDYYELSGSKLSKEAFAIKSQLSILIIFLQWPFIEKKIAALNEIKKLFERKNKVSKELQPEQLAQWLSDSEIIEYIYKEAKHPELISRSTELIWYLANYEKLNEETIEMLWETWVNEHKHEAVAEATLVVIASLAKILNEDMLKSFIVQIEALPISILGEYISIFKQFYSNWLLNLKSRYSKPAAEKKISKIVNLNIIWEAVQDEADLPAKNKSAALDALIELMILFDLSNTAEYLMKALENFKKGQSPIICMTVIEKILKSLARRGYPSVFKKEDLITISLFSAEKYLSDARENSPMEGRNIEDTIFSGTLAHKDTMKKYFDFIGFLLK